MASALFNVKPERGAGEKRERGETGREMESRISEGKSIVLNCIPNMGNLAEIKFGEKRAAVGKKGT